MQDQSFYLTLPANSSSHYFPNNKNSHYFTKLESGLNLKDGQWEIALADLQYPNSWPTVDKGEFHVSSISEDGDSQTVMAKLKPGRARTPAELIQRLNITLREKKINNEVRLSFDWFAHIVKIDVANNSTLTMSDDLSNIFGFKTERVFREGIHESERLVDIEGGFHSIYIYSNIVEKRAVGDKHLSLLQIVPTEGARHTSTNVQFLQRQYQRAATFDSDSVEIRLSREDGNDVPFTSGLVSMTLHIKRRL